MKKYLLLPLDIESWIFWFWSNQVQSAWGGVQQLSTFDILEFLFCLELIFPLVPVLQDERCCHQ